MSKRMKEILDFESKKIASSPVKVHEAFKQKIQHSILIPHLGKVILEKAQKHKKINSSKKVITNKKSIRRQIFKTKPKERFVLKGRTNPNSSNIKHYLRKSFYNQNKLQHAKPRKRKFKKWRKWRKPNYFSKIISILDSIFKAIPKPQYLSKPSNTRKKVKKSTNNVERKISQDFKNKINQRILMDRQTNQFSISPFGSNNQEFFLVHLLLVSLPLLFTGLQLCYPTTLITATLLFRLRSDPGAADEPK